MRKDEVKISQVKVPAIIFGPSFDNHMKFGDKSGQSHTGLHILFEFTKTGGQRLSGSDIKRNAQIAGTLNGKSTTGTIKEVDIRAKTFKAEINIYGKIKVSTFFPIGTTLGQAKNYIREAWKDHCTYGSARYGGGDVDIYKQMRTRYNLNWVGMATIAFQQIWIGSAQSGTLVTAIPAVNNMFS